MDGGHNPDGSQMSDDDQRTLFDRAAERAKRLGDQAELDRLTAMEDITTRAAARVSPVNFVDCRVFMHSWEPYEASRNPQGGGWFMVVRCVRCGTERSDVITLNGSASKHRYKYPEHYKDTDRWRRSDWRLQFLRRLG